MFREDEGIKAMASRQKQIVGTDRKGWAEQEYHQGCNHLEFTFRSYKVSQLIHHHPFVQPFLHYCNLFSSAWFICCAKRCWLVPFGRLLLIALTKLIGGEMLRPERLAVGEFHLVLQLQAIALGMQRKYLTSSSGDGRF